MKPPDILAAIKPVVEAFEKLFSTNWTGIVWFEGAAKFTGYGISSILGIRIRAYKSVKTGI